MIQDGAGVKDALKQFCPRVIEPVQRDISLQHPYHQKSGYRIFDRVIAGEKHPEGHTQEQRVAGAEYGEGKSTEFRRFEIAVSWGGKGKKGFSDIF